MAGKPLTPKDLAKTLYLALRDQEGTALQEGVERFVAALKRQGAERLLPRILEAMPEAVFEADADRRVTVESARRLDAAATQEVARMVGGSEADVVTRIVPELIGGVRIRTKDGVIDASVSGQIERIKAALQGAETT